jgi:2-amino-4-hydroxy-6-hydroxymethyldihydropteridine diphosphokinase
VAIGSNLNDPVARVLEAFDRLAGLRDCRLELRSRLYRSHPLGPQDQPDFVNAVAGMLTTLAARALLDALLAVEQSMGRRRDERWGPRIIDLDLLWMQGPPIDEPGLRVPHPALSARNFVVFPLADVCPTLGIAGLGRVSDLKNRVSDAGLSVIGPAL